MASELWNISLDLNANELQNATIQNLSADPVSPTPTEGRIYWNSVSDILKVYNGSTWNSVGIAYTGTAGITLTGTAFSINEGYQNIWTTPQIFRGAVGSNDVLYTDASGDTNPRFAITGAGAISWGSGGSSADVTLSRTGANVLALSTGDKIQSDVTPTTGNDLTNKTYVDTVATGLQPKPAVKYATAAALPNSPTYSSGPGTLTAGSNAAIAVDGQSPALNDRILVKDQASTFQNGIYTVTTVGSGAAPWVLTRAVDSDTGAELPPGTYVWVTAGSTGTSGNADTAWVISSDTAIPNLTSDAITWSLYSNLTSVMAGAGLVKSGNTIAIVSTGGITVNADDIAVNTGTGLEISSSAVRIATSAAGNGLTGGGGSALSINAAYANTWTTTQTIDLGATGNALNLDIHTGGGEKWINFTEGGSARGNLAELTDGMVFSTVNTFSITGGSNLNLSGGTGATTITAGTGITLSTTTGNISLSNQTDLGSHKIIGVSNGTATGDAIHWGQVTGTTNTTTSGLRWNVDCAASTTTTITHNWGTTDCLVEVIRASDGATVRAGITRTSNTVVVTFNTAPAAGDYRICVRR